MKIPIEGYQFLSRRMETNCNLRNRKSFPQERPDIIFYLDGAIEPKPFEINFAQLEPASPSIGAFEYIDDQVDFYLTRRWPYCLILRGYLTFPEENLTLDLVKNVLRYMRLLLWVPGDLRFKSLLTDQLSKTVGYRRTYFTGQIGDICRNRRPSPSERYLKTAIGDPVGPGLSCLPSVDPFKLPNELVWSEILSFPGATNQETDIGQIRKKIKSLKKHCNSYDELRSANRLLQQKEIKSTVRAAASAIDAVLRFYCEHWGVDFPSKDLPFDEKIEQVLSDAQKPSYKIAVPNGLETILYLYRCRNSMHEGDCYYSDKAGRRVDVKTLPQAKILLLAAEDFILWIDSHA